MDKKTPEKKERLLAALDQGMAMIHLDARRPGVLVPDHLKGENHLLLNLSYRFDPPDLSVGEWGVRATLTFSGKRFTVAVPWSALYAVSSHVTKEFWMYPEDMPKELLDQSHMTAKVPLEDTPLEQRARVQLREVVAEPSQADDNPGPPSPKDDPPKPASRGHLRVVK